MTHAACVHAVPQTFDHRRTAAPRSAFGISGRTSPLSLCAGEPGSGRPDLALDEEALWRLSGGSAPGTSKGGTGASASRQQQLSQASGSQQRPEDSRSVDDLLAFILGDEQEAR